MHAVDSYLYWLYAMTLTAVIGTYVIVTMYAFFVRDPSNFIVSLAMNTFAILSLPGKVQLLFSLIFVFFSIVFYQKAMPEMGWMMAVTAVMIFVFHSLQPLLYVRGQRYGMA